MIFIGERINAGFQDIKEAIQNKDPKAIKKWAAIQTDANATYLDVNLGTHLDRQQQAEHAAGSHEGV